MSEHLSSPPELSPDTFQFGRNWQRFISRHLSPERLRIAERSLCDLIGQDLRGKTFLDLGAGSGLFSLAALNLGASRVVSVDVDANSVASCEQLRSSVGDPPNWEILHGSVLDRRFVDQLDLADVVYSWGVLHHTGDMDTAVTNAASRVKPGGIFCIAIYNRVVGRFMTSERWLKVKRLYNRSPRFGQVLIEWVYLAVWGLTQIAKRQNPLVVARRYKERRGMAIATDFADWLGGYPYEYATSEEIVRFCERLSLQPTRVIAVSSTDWGNHEFVFSRTE